MFIRKKRTSEEEKARKLAKAREKQRKKLIKTKYGQRQKKHAKKGIRSCLFAFFATALLFMMLKDSFLSKGDVSVIVGLLGFVIPVIAWRGLLNARKGFHEREKNYITCKIGIGCNAAVLLFMCAIFIRGLF